MGPIKDSDIMLQLTDSQKCSLAIAPLDAKGQPAPVNGVPVWTSSDVTVVTVTAAADGMSAEAVATGVGIATITVTADADLGDVVQDITGTLAVTVTGGEAVTITITPGTPVSQ